jgi:hypothetical protein
MINLTLVGHEACLFCRSFSILLSVSLIVVAPWSHTKRCSITLGHPCPAQSWIVVKFTDFFWWMVLLQLTGTVESETLMDGTQNGFGVIKIASTPNHQITCYPDPTTNKGKWQKRSKNRTKQTRIFTIKFTMNIHQAAPQKIASTTQAHCTAGIETRIITRGG